MNFSPRNIHISPWILYQCYLLLPLYYNQKFPEGFTLIYPLSSFTITFSNHAEIKILEITK